MPSLSKEGFAEGKPLPALLWQSGEHPVLTGCGARELLGLRLTAFFASRQCPGSTIRAAMDWALQQASAKRPVVSYAIVATRLTQQLATQRNGLVAQLARSIVVAHASPDGSLAAQVGLWRQEGRVVQALGNPD